MVSVLMLLKSSCVWGSTSDPAGGAYDAPPIPLVELNVMFMSVLMVSLSWNAGHTEDY